MKKKLLLALFTLYGFNQIEAQTSDYWFLSETSKGKINTDKGVARLSFPKEFKLFELSINPLKQELFSTVGNLNPKHSAIISLPNADGKMEQFEVYEASNFEIDLQAQFPEIRAYSGKGITDRYATLKLSISPQGIQTMVFRTDKENEFIEPYSQDHTVYAVFKSQRSKGNLAWTCSTDDKNLILDVKSQLPNAGKSSAGQLKTMRLAQSCNGEYANYFGATSSAQVALVLAAFNATLTRCNGIYEKDLALHLNLVASSTNVIYYTPASDPYTTLSNWNKQLQTALSTTLTGPSTPLAANNAAYDIGHMFGASGGGGNAGCIGCVCTDDTSNPNDLNKGSGITSPADGIPQGDNFDVDYVAHEVGHQLGGNHTFSMSNEGTGVNMEVGSGVTVMGYAGITSQDVAPHSIDKFHAASIAQIQANLGGLSCPVTTSLAGTNATPVANAGANYTIPKSTPFALIGSATDADAGDVLTYSWEQYDDGAGQTGASSVASVGKTSGPNWVSWDATASPVRYLPIMATVLANAQTTLGTGNDGINVEALSSVARTLNFRLTVRDNVPYSSSAPIKVGQTSFANMTVTVNTTGAAFTVSSQNTAGISYVGLTTQTITWIPGSTASAPFNAANVKISLSTDNGLTFPTVLLASTPNDGTQTVTIPDGINSTDCRIKIEAVGNIFFNVNTTKFTITPSLDAADFEFENFGLYPNPNNGSFTLKFNSVSTNDIKINIHDLRGRAIFEKTYSNTGAFNQNINLNKVQAGIYLVTISDGAKKTVKRIIVQ